MLDKYRYSWYNKSVKDIVFFAAVVELADTRDLKSRGSNPVPVQVRSAAPRRNGLRSIPIFLCRKISHMLRHSSFFAKGHIRVGYSVASALITPLAHYQPFSSCAFGTYISKLFTSSKFRNRINACKCSVYAVFSYFLTLLKYAVFS